MPPPGSVKREAVAFLSATHDIAADGYYMLALSEHQQSFYVGIRTEVYARAHIYKF